jgi:hypothetical protein
MWENSYVMNLARAAAQKVKTGVVTILACIVMGLLIVGLAGTTYTRNDE